MLKIFLLVTGTASVPVGGFKQLMGVHGPQTFTITKVAEVNQLPLASTCFNLLKLPPYESLEKMKKNFDIAIKYGKEGFGFN